MRELVARKSIFIEQFVL